MCIIKKETLYEWLIRTIPIKIDSLNRICNDFISKHNYLKVLWAKSEIEYYEELLKFVKEHEYVFNKNYNIVVAKARRRGFGIPEWLIRKYIEGDFTYPLSEGYISIHDKNESLGEKYEKSNLREYACKSYLHLMHAIIQQGNAIGNAFHKKLSDKITNDDNLFTRDNIVAPSTLCGLVKCNESYVLKNKLFFEDKINDRNIIVCVLKYKNKYDRFIKYISIGFSITNPVDKFDKETGYLIAEERAKSDKTGMTMRLTPIAFKDEVIASIISSGYYPLLKRYMDNKGIKNKTKKNK